MIAVRGIFREGVAEPAEPVEGREGQRVIITFLDDEETLRTEATVQGWDALTQLFDDHEMSTGIEDLAHQHDYYLYGKPKRQDGAS